MLDPHAFHRPADVLLLDERAVALYHIILAWLEDLVGLVERKDPVTGKDNNMGSCRRGAAPRVPASVLSRRLPTRLDFGPAQSVVGHDGKPAACVRSPGEVGNQLLGQVVS